MQPAPFGQPLTAPPGTGRLALALASLAEVEFRLGDWQAAYASAVEALRVGQLSAQGDTTMDALSRLALVEAALGREDACRRHAEQALALAARHPSDSCQVLARQALGLLELGLGRLDAAVGWLQPLAQGSNPVAGGWASDLAEALIRRGDHERAADALAALAAHAEDFTVRRALERCGGLIAPDDEFEAHFARALDCGGHLEEPFERARTELCYGQRLRRAGRRHAAREHLRAALATFERLGAALWSETARRELGASGERARRRVDLTRDELTAQERQVAQIVAEGATNRETATRLFVSTKTIETHLGRIYRKLGVRSRTELARRFTSGTVPAGNEPPPAERANGFRAAPNSEPRAVVIDQLERTKQAKVHPART
jgi:DNA-binding CsgD family transcriptional regulator